VYTRFANENPPANAQSELLARYAAGSTMTL
jgi:hypothetical protein